MADMKKELEIELEKVNTSLGLGNKVTIASSTDYKKCGNKEGIWQSLKMAYNLAEKAIKAIPTHSMESNSCQMLAIVKEELAKTLPQIIQESLATAHRGSDLNVRSPPAEKIKHTLVVEKKSEDSEGDNKISGTEWTQVVKKDLKRTLSRVPVVKTNPPKTEGVAKLVFKSKEDLNQAEEALKSKYRVTSKSEELKKLNPKITISGLDAEIKTKQELEDGILKKNDSIKSLMEKGDQFKVVFLDDKDRFAVLQVSPAIREVIKKAGNRICLGLEMYPVRDRYHVIQCYHCQGFGHTSGSIHCKSKDSDPTCFYCAGNHKSKDCSKKEKRRQGI